MTDEFPDTQIERKHCLAVRPGYETFPARCNRFADHIGKHESQGRVYGHQFPPAVWSDEDNPFTSEE